MKNRNLDFEETIVKLGELKTSGTQAKKPNLLRAIIDRIAKTGHIDHRAGEIIKEEITTKEDK